MRNGCRGVISRSPYPVLLVNDGIVKVEIIAVSKSEVEIFVEVSNKFDLDPSSGVVADNIVDNVSSSTGRTIFHMEFNTDSFIIVVNVRREVR